MSMKTWAGVAAAIAVSTLWYFSGRFFRAEETLIAEQHEFQELRIERPEKRIAAPNFTLEDLAGKSVSLRQFEGRVVFLNFWATWCVPCRAEMPAMEKLHRDLKKQGLEIVAVNLRESREQVEDFTRELGLTFTVLLDRDGVVSAEYGVWSVPLSYFINREGEFVGKAIGAREWDAKEGKAFFRSLLAEER